MPSRKRVRHVGHPAAFSSEQNRHLRAALRGLKRQKGLSQAEVGETIGVSQQVAGRLLSQGRAGMSYGTATTLVRCLGFVGVDEFFASHATRASDESGALPAADDELTRTG